MSYGLRMRRVGKKKIVVPVRAQAPPPTTDAPEKNVSLEEQFMQDLDDEEEV